MQAIGEIVLRWRIAHGMTNSELARRLGVSESTLWNWTHGGAAPGEEHRKRLMAYLTQGAPVPPPRHPMPVAERIVMARRLRGWSQRTLAQALGTSPATVVYWESGNPPHRGDLRERLRQFLGAPPDDLWLGDIGRVLRAWRTRHALSQLDVAQRLGVSTSRLSAWECGRTRPETPLHRRIVALLSGPPPRPARLGRCPQCRAPIEEVLGPGRRPTGIRRCSRCLAGERTCLGLDCGTTFWSAGPWQRLCPACRGPQPRAEMHRVHLSSAQF